MSNELKIIEEDFSHTRPKKVRIMIAEIATFENEWVKKDDLWFMQNTSAFSQQIEEYLLEAQAAGTNADLVIFPEVSVPFDCIERVRVWSANTGAIVVAGSHYHKQNDNYYGRGVVIVNGNIFYTYKRIPAPDEISTDLNLGLKPGNEYRIFKNTRAGNIAVLICSDFLDLNLRQNVLNYDIDLLCVPACQHASDDYHSRMETMSEDTKDGLYIAYVNMRFGKFGDGRSAFFGNMHRKFRNKIKPDFQWNYSTSTKVLQMPYDNDFVVLEIDISIKRPPAMLTVHSRPNVSIVRSGETAAFAHARRSGKIFKSLDHVTLSDFIKYSKVIERIDSKTAQSAKLEIVSSPKYIEIFLKRLLYLDITSVEKLEALLVSNEGIVTAFMTEWFNTETGHDLAQVPNGMGVSFLCTTLVIQKNNDQLLNEYWKRFAFRRTVTSEQLAAEMKKAYAAAEKIVATRPSQDKL